MIALTVAEIDFILKRISPTGGYSSDGDTCNLQHRLSVMRAMAERMEDVGFSPSFSDVEAAQESDASIGWCRACGTEHEQVEPDAEHYLCSACQRRDVHGVDVYVSMGWVDIS